ncbi:MAG TPA: hypothetical protein VIH35_05695, partial [Kiritimatiellia bacterium]
MARISSIVLVLVLVLAPGAARAGRIIAEGDAWRYYKGRSTPSNTWNEVGFGDSIWGGPAPSGFGYGDGDDGTFFNDMENDFGSVYLRRTFVITSTATVTHLTLAADYDDGFVAYINGTEVARVNLPGGTVTHTTLATNGHECSRSDDGTSNAKEYFTLSKAALVNGTNVLAVSGHNSSEGSSDFSLIVELYTNVTLVRGPFLQLPGTNGVQVTWLTDALTDSVVEYGTDTNYAGGVVSNGALTRSHAIAIGGLLPGTGYYYRIHSGGVALGMGGPFRAPAATNQAFRFGIIGDFGYSGPGTTSIAARVNATNIDFLTTVGDNIYLYGQAGDYDAYWFTPYAETLRRSPLMPAIGNHDINLGNDIWYVGNFDLPTNGPA